MILLYKVSRRFKHNNKKGRFYENRPIDLIVKTMDSKTNKKTIKTSFPRNGFWLHVTWNSTGTYGIDQHGHEWFDINNPHQ